MRACEGDDVGRFIAGRFIRASLTFVVLWSMVFAAARAGGEPKQAVIPDLMGARALRAAALLPHDASALDALTAEEVALASPVLAQVRVLEVTTSPVRRYSASVQAVAYDLTGRVHRPLTILDTGPFQWAPGRSPIVALFAPLRSAQFVVQPSLAAVGFVDGDTVVFRRAGGGEERYPLAGHSVFACLLRPRAACRESRLAAFGVSTRAQVRAFSDLAVPDPLAPMLWMLIRQHDRSASFPSAVCTGTLRGDCASSAAFRRRSGFRLSM